MFVVTRTFRDANGVFGVGSVVDPTSVKTFKSRLQQRHIVDINAANIDQWQPFFERRYGIDLNELLGGSAAATEEPSVTVPPEEVVSETPSDGADESDDW